jgi:hypothetical protein
VRVGMEQHRSRTMQPFRICQTCAKP